MEVSRPQVLRWKGEQKHQKFFLCCSCFFSRYNCLISLRIWCIYDLDAYGYNWNSKQPVLYGCFNWMIQNLYMGNGCFSKHPCINGCLEFQVCNNLHQLIPHEAKIEMTIVWINAAEVPRICPSSCQRLSDSRGFVVVFWWFFGSSIWKNMDVCCFLAVCLPQHVEFLSGSNKHRSFHMLRLI